MKNYLLILNNYKCIITLLSTKENTIFFKTAYGIIGNGLAHILCVALNMVVT